MARLPRYQSNEQVGHVPGGGRATAPDALGRALTTAGNIGEQTAGMEYARGEREAREAERRAAVLRAAEDRREVVRAHVAMSQFELDAATAQAQQADADVDAPFGHGERVAKGFDERAAKLREGFQNPAAQDWLDQNIAASRTRHLTGALGYEMRQTRIAEARDFGKIADARGSAAAADESIYDTQAEAVDAAGEMLRQSPEAREKARNALAVRTAEGFTERRPAAALALFNQRLGISVKDGEARTSLNLQAAAPAAAAAALRELTGEDVAVPSGAGPVTLELRDVSRQKAVEALRSSLGVETTPGKTGVDWIDRLNVEQVRVLRNRAETAQRQGTATLQATIRAREADATEAAGRGEVRPIPSEAEYVAAYGEPGREAYRRASAIPRQGEVMGSLSGLPLADLQATLAKPLPGPGAPAGDYKQASDAQQQQAAAATRIIERRQRDWIAAAAEQKVATIVPIDWSKPDAALEGLRTRQGVAQMAPAYAGTPVSGVLTTGEAAAFRGEWHRMDPMARAGVLRTMRDALTDRTVYGATVQQIAPDDAVARSAAVLAEQNDPRALAIAGTLLRGGDILNPGKAARSEDGKPIGKPVSLPKDFDAVVADTLGEALVANPGAYQGAKQAIAAYYTAIASDAGKFGRENTDSDLVKRAIADVVGEVTKWSGIGSVLAPWGMPAPAARAALDRAWTDAMTAAGYADTPVADRSRSRLIADPAAQGRYLIAAGEKFLTDKKGEPIVLDIRPPRMPRGLSDQVPK